MRAPKPRGLKLVMAVSADDFVCRGPDDDMGWTGPDDKKVFRLLTHVGGVLGVGSTTARSMPLTLPGRTMHVLSTRPRLRLHDQEMLGVTLGEFAYRFPGAWLLGGQTVAMEALGCGLVDEVHLCRSPASLGSGVPDRITPYLASRGEAQNPGDPWARSAKTRIGEVLVEAWRACG